MNFEDRLLEIAKADEIALEAQEHIREYEARIKILKQDVNHAKDLREQLRKDALAYVEETGDLTIHEDIVYKRTSKWAYDADDALGWAEANAKEFTRVKVTLDKRKFEAALKDGLDYPGAEKINTPTIAIPAKLGHLIIKDETS